MTEIVERHEVRVRGRDHSIVFSADSEDGRLVIRQESNGWSKEEEQQVAKRFKAGEPVPAIAGAHKRSPRAIELRLQQRIGLLQVD